MNLITQKILDFIQDEEGLTTVEYAVAGSLVAAAVVIAFTDLGGAVGDAIDGLTTDIGGTPTSAGG
ncbi:Flp family type IVb pilin [Marinobacterium stanieri]|uniref:Flp family type IVb pilin n=1 Tax=Marinobacterium stanieri TaxID=49186 RepID=UPI003A9438E9